MALHQWRPLGLDGGTPESSVRASQPSSQTWGYGGKHPKRLCSSLSAGGKSRREVLGDHTNRVTASYEAAASEGSELLAILKQLELGSALLATLYPILGASKGTTHVATHLSHSSCCC